MNKSQVIARSRSVLNLTLACGLLLLPAAVALAQTNAAPKILFLHVKLDKQKSVSLVKVTTRDGQLKPQPNQDISEGLHFELLSAEGKLLWHGVIPDPTVRMVEHEDPPGSGKLKRKQFQLAETEFTVRAPYLAEADRVEFYIFTQPDSTNSVQRKKLGTLPLARK